jgi:hypothetical protein
MKINSSFRDFINENKYGAIDYRDESKNVIIKALEKELDIVANGGGSGYKDIKTSNKGVSILFDDEEQFKDFDECFSEKSVTAKELNRIANSLKLKVSKGKLEYNFNF